MILIHLVPHFQRPCSYTKTVSLVYDWCFRVWIFTCSEKITITNYSTKRLRLHFFFFAFYKPWLKLPYEGSWRLYWRQYVNCSTQITSKCLLCHCLCTKQPAVLIPAGLELSTAGNFIQKEWLERLLFDVNSDKKQNESTRTQEVLNFARSSRIFCNLLVQSEYMYSSLTISYV